MTCRHSAGDTSCSSHPANIEARRYENEREQERRSIIASVTPDAANYSIEDVCRVGPHLVLKVKYPNCSKCSYEGSKVMVFLNVTEVEVLRWKRIDPHFRAPMPKLSSEAPGPAARFPASKEGWADAVAYATGKQR